MFSFNLKKGLKKYSVLMTVHKDIELTIWAKDEDAANSIALELSQDQYESSYITTTDEGEIEVQMSQSVDQLMGPEYTTGSEIHQTVEVK
tara:strand:+ start:338 stop:607 length:270 start_codon:yes stop_codon:yes gene_type:complete